MVPFARRLRRLPAGRGNSGPLDRHRRRLLLHQLHLLVDCAGTPISTRGFFVEGLLIPDAAKERPATTCLPPAFQVHRQKFIELQIKPQAVAAPARRMTKLINNRQVRRLHHRRRAAYEPANRVLARSASAVRRNNAADFRRALRRYVISCGLHRLHGLNVQRGSPVGLRLAQRGRQSTKPLLDRADVQTPADVEPTTRRR